VYVLVPGEGKVIINNRPLAEYFGKKTLEMIAKQPLALTVPKPFQRHCQVEGGGITGQSRRNSSWHCPPPLKADLKWTCSEAGGLLTRPTHERT
jgi:small subunit ribosomal protein S9